MIFWYRPSRGSPALSKHRDQGIRATGNSVQSVESGLVGGVRPEFLALNHENSVVAGKGGGDVACVPFSLRHTGALPDSGHAGPEAGSTGPAASGHGLLAWYWMSWTGPIFSWPGHPGEAVISTGGHTGIFAHEEMGGEGASPPTPA